jgi:hypothetical protein
VICVLIVTLVSWLLSVMPKILNNKNRNLSRYVCGFHFTVHVNKHLFIE